MAAAAAAVKEEGLEVKMIGLLAEELIKDKRVATEDG